MVQRDDPNALGLPLRNPVDAPDDLQDLVDIVGTAQDDDVGAVVVQVQPRIRRLEVKQKRIHVGGLVVEVVNKLLALGAVQIAAQRPDGKAEILLRHPLCQ